MNVGRVETISADGGVRVLYDVHRSETHVDGAALLRETEKLISRFVILPKGALLPLALWAVATHTFESFDSFGYLAVTSPTKQCGKTRLLECLELIVHESRRATNPSEASLFRMIEKFRPTLFLTRQKR